MSYKRYINNHGATLVELIIVIVLIGIIIVPLGTAFISKYNQFFADSAKINAESDMRIAQNQVLDHLRQADQNSIAIETEQRIKFNIDQNGTTYNCAVWYDAVEKKLMIQAPSGERELLSNVSEVSFTYVTDGRINIKLTTVTILPSDSYTDTQTFDYKKRI